MLVWSLMKKLLTVTGRTVLRPFIYHLDRTDEFGKSAGELINLSLQVRSVMGEWEVADRMELLAHRMWRGHKYQLTSIVVIGTVCILGSWLIHFLMGN